MTISRFLDPKNDVAFKKIFGSEKNKDILIHFINDILDFKGDKEIQDVEFLSTIQDAEIASKKQSIVDVLCKDRKGIQYIIEMQVAPQPKALKNVLSITQQKHIAGKLTKAKMENIVILKR